MGTRTIALAACALALAAPEVASALAISDRNALESAVIARVNEIRTDRGLRRLGFATRLRTAATKHSRDMARNGYFSHSWSSGAGFSKWIRWYWPGPGYSSWSAGENLFWASPSTRARQVVRAWMGSPGHRANMLGREWRRIGVGAIHVTDPVGTYRSADSVTIVAAEFGRRS